VETVVLCLLTLFILLLESFLESKSHFINFYEIENETTQYFHLFHPVLIVSNFIDILLTDAVLQRVLQQK